MILKPFGIECMSLDIWWLGSSLEQAFDHEMAPLKEGIYKGSF